MRTKIVCYCNTYSVFTSNILLNSLLKKLENDIKVVSIVETSNLKKKFTFFDRFKRIVSLILNLKKLNLYIFSVLSLPVEKMASKHNIDFNIPENSNINSKEHIQYIDSLKSKDIRLIGLVFGCPQIIKEELLSKYDCLINYHDSYLPAYRGLNATAWSRYESRDKSGYTFHFINNKVDGGDILFQELLRYDKNWNIHQHLYFKALSAGNNISKIIEFIHSGQLNKTKKESYSSLKSYYSSKMKSELMKLARTNKLNTQEKSKFTKAFGVSV